MDVFLTCDSEGYISLFKISLGQRNYKIERTTTQKENRFRAHRGAVTAFDYDHQKGLMASGGEDGCLKFHPLSDFPDLKVTQQICASSVTIDSVRFASPSVVVFSQGSTISMWDLRSPPSQGHVASLGMSKEKDYGSLGSAVRFWDVAVHPTQPHLCLAGDSKGSISIWDTRMSTSSNTQVPPYYTHSRAHWGNIWHTTFVPTVPGLILSCGEDGQFFSWDFYHNRLGSATPVYPEGPPGVAGECHVVSWMENVEGLNDFDFCGSTVVVATESESLVFLKDILEEIRPGS